MSVARTARQTLLSLTAALGVATPLLLLGLAGCGGSTEAPSPTAVGTRPGPHGGPAVPLPGGKGYAEVVLDRSGVKPGANTGAKLLVYFLDGDLKAELAPLPTEVSIKAVPPGAEPTTVTLKADPASDNSPGAKGRFSSPPGNFDYDELRGDVIATIGGQSETIPFAFR